jgi:hypothetical protein
VNEQELRRLLTVSVEDVLPSHPAVAGWERARRTRRTRRAVGAVALAVVLIVFSFAILLGLRLAPWGPAIGGAHARHRAS